MGITTRHEGFDEAAPSGLMTPEQVATYLGCGRTYAYERLRTGEIPSLKLGRLRRVRREDLEWYVNTLLESRSQHGG
jgi:excisionase family DNA binding protein